MEQIVAKLKQVEHEIDLNFIYELLTAQSTLKDFRQYVRFDEEKYQRNVILKTNFYELVCVCWLPGQFSSIHSHGTSFGAMRILEGQVTEDLYLTPDNPVYQRRIYTPSDCSKVTPETLHSVGNTSDKPASSLHLYSPPFQGQNFSQPRNLSETL